MGKMKEVWMAQERDREQHLARLRQMTRQQDFYRVLDALSRPERESFQEAISSVEVTR